MTITILAFCRCYITLLMHHYLAPEVVHVWWNEVNWRETSSEQAIVNSTADAKMITMSVAAATPLPCFKNHSIISTKSFNSKPPRRHFDNATISSQSLPPVQKQRRVHLTRTVVCHAARRKPTVAADASKASAEGNDNVRRVLQIVLWAAEAVYILWLFLLPYAPVRFNLAALCNFFLVKSLLSF